MVHTISTCDIKPWFYPVGIPGFRVIGCKSECLLEMLKGFVHVVLIVETQTSNKHRVRVHTLQPQDVTETQTIKPWFYPDG